MTRISASAEIKEIMTKDVIIATTGENAIDAVKRMIDNDIECLPVVDSESRLCGLVTFRDIVSKIVYDNVPPTKAKISDIMTKKVITCSPHSTILEVVKLMKNRKIRRVPVVDENGKLIGIVTNFDLSIVGWEVET
jgi:CBS domain-containing protein